MTQMAGDPRMHTQGVHVPALEPGSAALRVIKRIISGTRREEDLWELMFWSREPQPASNKVTAQQWQTPEAFLKDLQLSIAFGGVRVYGRGYTCPCIHVGIKGGHWVSSSIASPLLPL